jgi:two-component system, OmpR family, phosphate regulon sensor histidine kinase PhoR
MASDNQERPLRVPRFLMGRSGVRWVLAATGAVLAILVALKELPFLHGLAGFLVVAAVAWLVTERSVRGGSVLATADAPAARSEALLDALIASLPDAAILVDREGRVIAFNTGARSIAPALARGQAATLALRVPEIVEAVREATSLRETRRVEFYQRVPIDRWFVVHVAPLIGANAAPDPSGLMLLTFQDLTPLRRSEEMRADFVANASHELRTPLASLSGFIDTLQGPARDDGPARARFLAIMKTQASRMARLIDDLLSLSRIELNEHLHPDKPVDLVAVVRQVTDGLQTLAQDRDVEINIVLPPGPVVVPGDRDELTRVFENLTENALKYGASGKRVDIAFKEAVARDGGSDILVSVRDHGPGIAAEHLPRLTERFYRVDVTQSRAEGGTGLGLALVKHILSRHRGRLLIESEAGKGATFTARLPLISNSSDGKVAELAENPKG